MIGIWLQIIFLVFFVVVRLAELFSILACLTWNTVPFLVKSYRKFVLNFSSPMEFRICIYIHLSTKTRILWMTLIHSDKVYTKRHKNLETSYFHPFIFKHNLRISIYFQPTSQNEKVMNHFLCLLPQNSIINEPI